jgi:hypothetical protein
MLLLLLVGIIEIVPALMAHCILLKRITYIIVETGVKIFP